MTVQTNTNSISYVGNGSTVHFDYDFLILDAGHLMVYFGDALQTSGYVVSGVLSQTGGTVAFASAPGAGVKITLTRSVPFLQLTDYQPYDAFPADSHERALDLLTMMAQQLKDASDRSMQYPVGGNRWDAKSNEIINVAAGNSDTSAPNIGQVKQIIAAQVGDDPSASASIRSREALRRSCAEAGYNLVAGSFEVGGTLVNTNDVLLQDSTGKVFSGPAGEVIADTDPASGGFVDKSHELLRTGSFLTIKAFGGKGDGTDESSIVEKMLFETGMVYIPAGMTIVAKNIQVAHGSQIICDGTLKLPAGCSDFDRLIYGANKSGVVVRINEINGNAAGQSGAVGTHLIYLTNCPDASVDIRHAHDHHIDSSVSLTPIDGVRNDSSGAIFLYRCHKSNVNVGLLSGWGREGIYLEECDDSVAKLGHAQGTGTTEYSGIQVKGNRSKLLRASVDNAGASGVGFDVIDGIMENIISTNTRENHGVNLGHPGFPASRSRCSNIVVDGCFVDGIKVSASTEEVLVSNFAVKDAGRFGISVSDSSTGGTFSDGVVSGSGWANIHVSATEIKVDNVKYEATEQTSLLVSMTSGLFQAGDVITASGGKSAVVLRVIPNLTGQEQVLLVGSVSGSFAPSDVVSGAPSLAVGTVIEAHVQSKRLEQNSGSILEPVRRFPGSQDQIRFENGDAIMTASISCAVAAAGALQDFTVGLSSNVIWQDGPTISATVTSATSTGNYTVSQLRARMTTAELTISMIASVAQTYGIQIIAVGKWK